ncbi:glucokinase [Parasynechococcus sp.]|uniref:glucokinase n=1 Tax=Parasynechococcus sp. TaxID=3101203 RepID=UPI003703DCCF
MVATTLLAGDMGGTKTLLALYEVQTSGVVQRHQRRYVSREWSSLEPMLSDFVHSRPAGVAAPVHGCIAVAGPVRNRQATITNLPWQLQEDDLARAADMQQLELVNDFVVLIYGLPNFDEHQQSVLQAGSMDAGTMAILGAGTGLGMAKGLQTQHGLIALPSEGGHREFAARSDEEWRLAQWLKDDLNLERLSVERVVSGTGLGHIARWLLLQPESTSHPLQELARTWPQTQTHDLPAQASEAASNGDPLMQHALDLWLSAYGSAAGDLALQELCTGGLWIGGGTAAKQLAGLQSAAFLDALRNKGRFESLMKGLQITAVIDPQAGLFSAACRAKMLAESGGTLS